MIIWKASTKSSKCRRLDFDGRVLGVFEANGHESNSPKGVHLCNDERIRGQEGTTSLGKARRRGQTMRPSVVPWGRRLRACGRFGWPGTRRQKPYGLSRKRRSR